MSTHGDTRWPHFKKCLMDENYQNCHLEAEKRLDNEKARHRFSFAQILEDAGLNDSASVFINFDFVLRMCQLQHQPERRFVPLAEAAFGRHKIEDETNNPLAYVALGQGKQTAGYALVHIFNQHLTLAYKQWYGCVVGGIVEADNALTVAMQRSGILANDQEQLALPPDAT